MRPMKQRKFLKVEADGPDLAVKLQVRGNPCPETQVIRAPGRISACYPTSGATASAPGCWRPPSPARGRVA